MRWATYSVQLAIVKTHMCVVALTASIAACNIKLVDAVSAVRHECDTEQILVAGIHSKEIGWCRSLIFFSVQPLCSLCLCGYKQVRYSNHRDTETQRLHREENQITTPPDFSNHFQN